MLVSHSMLDAYAAIMPSSIVLLESRCGLSNEQSAWVLGVGPLFSGLAQPVAAWISDRTDSRLFTGLGLAISAVCMCLLGVAHDFVTLLAIYIPAMIAGGAFHPVSAASVGELSGRRRSWGASSFFVFGMIGGSAGAFLAPRFLALEGGFESLRIWMIPGVVMAGIAYLAVAPLSHRGLAKSPQTAPELRENAVRWRMMGILYGCAAIRFSVNMALVYLYARWMEQLVMAAHPAWSKTEAASQAAAQAGTLVSMTILGMGIGGILAGFLIPAGREKWPLVFVPLISAPLVWILPSLHGIWIPLGCAAAGAGFASMVPVGIAVSQRLLPHRTSLASGLMMGGAWAISMIGPRLAQWGLTHFGLVITFEATAVVLALSGLLAIPLRTDHMRRST